MSLSRLEALKKFLKDDPNDTFTHYAIALEYVSMRRFPDAIIEFEEVVRLDPSYIPGYHQLGLLFGEIDRVEDARKTLEKGIQVAAKSDDLHARDVMQEALDNIKE